MRTTGGVIALYRDWQDALARWGDTHVATDRFFRLAREIEADPFLDTQGFEAVLDRLHVQADPEARSRPPRLHTGPLQSILEDH
jgi:hypothetical protein